MIEAFHYPSLTSFVDAIEAPLVLESNFRSRESFKNGYMGGLAGLTQSSTWIDVKTLWFNGWPEGLAKMRETLGTMEAPQVKSRKRVARWADSGDEYSRERMEEGYFDSAWREVKRLSRRQPVPVRLTIDVEAHVNIAHGDLFWRGAAVVLLADALATAGYPISVVATSGADGMAMINAGGSRVNYQQYITILVKDWETPVYLPTLISTTGHGAFLRVGVFAHNVQKMPEPHDGGMGFSKETSSQRTLRELGFSEQNIKTITMPQSVGTLATAKQWVAKMVDLLEEEV